MMINYSNNQYMIEDSNSKISLSQKKKKKSNISNTFLLGKKKGCQSISLETIFWKFFMKKKNLQFFIFSMKIKLKYS